MPEHLKKPILVVSVYTVVLAREDAGWVLEVKGSRRIPVNDRGAERIAHQIRNDTSVSVYNEDLAPDRTILIYRNKVYK